MVLEPPPPIRYSRQPPQDYQAFTKSALLQRPEVWNLAYLSHDYDRRPRHPDAEFVPLVRKTAQFCLSTCKPDLTFMGQNLLAEKLLMPAPWFVNWLHKNPRIKVQLPLFQAYGQAWLGTIEQRARMCHTHDNPDDDLPLGDLTQAKGLLLQLARR